ncbi:MAG TPA: hypothetical protein VKZ60_15625 [Chloroflexota bacterium]|nr:hypothetical protein [Chloroflexota bacterium]
MLWVYDLTGVDLEWWSAAAPAELAATATPGDQVLMLLEGMGPAACQRLMERLHQAGYPARWDTVEQRPALVIDVVPARATARPAGPAQCSEAGP